MIFFFFKETLHVNSRMTQQTILSEIRVSLQLVNGCEVLFFKLQCLMGSKGFVDSHKGKEACQPICLCPPGDAHAIIK